MTMTAFTPFETVMVLVRVGHEAQAMMRFPSGNRRFNEVNGECTLWRKVAFVLNCDFCDFCVRLSETVFFCFAANEKMFSFAAL